MKIFYHTDCDGKASGHIIHDAIIRGRIMLDRVEGIDLSIEFIPVNYADVFPLAEIIPNETVYIVDYSTLTQEMMSLLSVTKNVIWIDHHETAINDYKGFPAPIQGLRETGRAGCVLTYMHIWNCAYRDVPEYIRLIGDRDVWKFEYGDRTRDFCAGIQMLDLSPTSVEWGRLRVIIDHWCGIGRHINRYRESTSAQYIKSWGFEAIFEGHRCLAVNGRLEADAYEAVKDKYDIAIGFVFNGVTWQISFYSKTVDVASIAKKYGGGGHLHASGCNLAELPFRKT